MRVEKKFVKLGTGSGEISASDLSANFASPANYTPASADVKGHLSGIDTALAGVSATPGDISHTSFSLANNQATYANITGLAFANGTVRAASIQYSVYIDATSDLFETGELEVIQRGSDWLLSRSSTGDISFIDIDINTSGQLQYKSNNFVGFVAGVIKFRAKATLI